MKKVALILAIFVSISFGNDATKQAINENCGNVELSKCIEHFKNRCNSGNMLECGFAGDLLYHKRDFYEAKRYFQMACEKVNLSQKYEIISAHGQKYKGDYEATKFSKARFCYNLGITYKELPYSIAQKKKIFL